MKEIKGIIQEKLDEIERKENVKILHCIESGSRAWGFASPDSDYDVRFIYIHPKDFYLRLDKTRDVIEWQLDDTLDINGWDLKKTLTLLHNSNPTLFEWNASPIVYRTSEAWGKISRLITGYFNSKSGLYHYLSTAKGNYREYLRGDEVRLKKYFYVLRPVLACKWILAEGTPPPMLFSTLAEKYLDEGIKGEVEMLLQKKMHTPELGRAKKIPALNAYLEENILSLTQIVERMPDTKKEGWEQLNQLFLHVLGENEVET